MLERKKSIFTLIQMIIVITLTIVVIGITRSIFISKKTMASVPNKSSFTISNVVFDPAEAKVGENISAILPSIPMTITDNSLPNIKAELVGDIRRDININTNIKIEYSIIGEDFQYTDDSNQLLPKDVITLVDTSTAMDANKMQQFKISKNQQIIYWLGIYGIIIYNCTIMKNKHKYSIVQKGNKKI